MEKVSIITPYYKPIIGGITTFVYNLRKGLEKKGWQVQIIACMGDKGEGIDVVGKPGPFYFFKCISAMKKHEPDVIHAHSHWYILPAAIIYKSFAGAKLLFTFHTELIARASIDAIVRPKIMAIEALINKTDHISFVSEYLRNSTMRNITIKRPISTIYPGASLYKDPAHSEILNFQEKNEITKSSPVLCMMAIMEWDLKVKGIIQLINAFSIVLKTFPSAKLLIVGKGSRKRLVETEIERLKMQGSVRVIEEVSKPSLSIAASDIYMHISLKDNVPISIIEAMSQGKPIIASNIGGIPELVDNGRSGILVDNTADEIANAIINLYEQKEKYNKMSSRSRKLFTEKFTWDKAIDSFITIYRSL